MAPAVFQFRSIVIGTIWYWEWIDPRYDVTFGEFNFDLPVETVF